MPKQKKLKPQQKEQENQEEKQELQKLKIEQDMEKFNEETSSYHKVISEVLKLRDHFKKGEKLKDTEIFPPLLYMSLRLFMESAIDLEKARLEGLKIINHAVEEEFRSRKYFSDRGYTTRDDAFNDLIKDGETTIQ